MDSNLQKFLLDVLGKDGSSAFNNSFAQNPKISSVVIPQTILLWSENLFKNGYEGKFPGIDNSLLKVEKNCFLIKIGSRDTFLNNTNPVELATLTGNLFDVNFTENKIDEKCLKTFSASIDLLIKYNLGLKQ